MECAQESNSRSPILLCPICPQAQQETNDTQFGVPRCICHAYVHLLLLHCLSQIRCLLDLSLPNLGSSLKIPWSLKQNVWVLLVFKCDGQCDCAVSSGHVYLVQTSSHLTWIPIFPALSSHHENFEGSQDSPVSGEDLKSQVSWLGHLKSPDVVSCTL